MAATARIVARLKDQPGPLLPVLHAVQHELGCIPAEAVQTIAEALNLSRAEVHGVITFYPHFRSAPAGRHVIEICRAESCQAMGGNNSPSMPATRWAATSTPARPMANSRWSRCTAWACARNRPPS